MDARREGYACPGDRHLGVSWHLTPPQFSLHSFLDDLPFYLFYGFGISFLGVVLAIGIFRPRKQMPIDMFQVRGSAGRALGLRRTAGGGAAVRAGAHRHELAGRRCWPSCPTLLRSSHTHRPHAPHHPPRQAMEFAQSKGNARRDGSTGVTFSDVGGLQPVMSEMMEVVEVRGAGGRV